MAHEEAFSRKHSVVSENQRPFTAKPLHGADAEDAKESKPSQNQPQRPFTTEDTEATEGGKALPLIHGKPGQANADEQERISNPNTGTPRTLGSPAERAEALALKLAQTYEELSRLLERNPGVKRQITEGATKEDKVYQKLKQRLKMADMAPRCQWVRQDGTSCGSPQMKQHIYCFAHMQMAEARDLMRLPPPEDPNAIQVGLMRIQKAVIEDTISMKKAGLLLYSMQLALTNVGQTTFGQAKDEEMVRETMSEEEAFNEKQNQHQNQHQHKNQRPFTAKDAQPPQQAKTGLAGGPGHAKEIGSSEHPDVGASENWNLPRMNAEDRGFEGARGPVEWKPTPDMYRIDTAEGREAYEASFGTKIAPALAGERRPVQGAVGAEERTPPSSATVPAEHAQTYANLG